MTKFLHAVGDAAIDMALAQFNREAWRDLRTGFLMMLVAGLYFAFRVLVLVLFPITLPLLVWARADMARRATAARADLRAGIHRNGR